MKKIALFLTCSLAVACGDDGGTDVTDTTTPMDMGQRDDGGPVDSGAPVDSGTVDMGGTTSMCPAGVCDLVTNDGCATGEGCYFAAAMAGDPAAPLCAPAGTLADGAACANANDCQEGFICLGTPGACHRICCGGNNEHCMPGTTGQLCLLNIVDADDMDTGVGACLLPDDCDPIAQTGCTDPDACFPTGDGAFSCRAPGTAVQGESCDTERCAAGFLCIGGDTGPECAALCDRSVADPACSDAALTCNSVTGYDAIGVCVP